MTTMIQQTERRLYATWRPSGGLDYPVGILTRFGSVDAGEKVVFRFVHLKVAEQLDGFNGMSGISDLHRVYESEHLFPVFSNRLMRRRRPDYPKHVRELNLDVNADPFDVMARSEGQKATDRYGVFAPPERTPDGDLTTLFLCRGTAEWPRDYDAIDAVCRLAPGERLTLLSEPDNPPRARAVLTNGRTGEKLGWMPNYLADMIHELSEFFATEVVITAEHINSPDTTALSNLLLCRLRAPWPEGYEPLSGPEYQPIVSV